MPTDNYISDDYTDHLNTQHDDRIEMLQHLHLDSDDIAYMIQIDFD